ncbi:MAG: DnaA/Hda family protein [Pseudomonadota bacterium]
MGQLHLDLPQRTALDRAAFFVAPCNAVALGMIENWQSWTQRKLLLNGPEGAGKTHLAHVWAHMAGARVLNARDLHQEKVPALAQTPLAVEDIPQIAGDLETEEALFHLHNLMLAEGQSLLLTGTGPVSAWGLSLADLVSRIEGTMNVAVQAPDDQLLAALLVKLFADRQMIPKPTLIPYLIKRMDRSFAAAINTVERLDAGSLAQKRPITRALAAEILGYVQ